MNGTEVKMVFLADFGELGVEVDLVTFNETLESLQVVVDDAVVEIQTPSAAAAADTAAAARHA